MSRNFTPIDIPYTFWIEDGVLHTYSNNQKIPLAPITQPEESKKYTIKVEAPDGWITNGLEGREFTYSELMNSKELSEVKLSINTIYNSLYSLNSLELYSRKDDSEEYAKVPTPNSSLMISAMRDFSYTRESEEGTLLEIASLISPNSYIEGRNLVFRKGDYDILLKAIKGIRPVPIYGYVSIIGNRDTDSTIYNKEYPTEAGADRLVKAKYEEHIYWKPSKADGTAVISLNTIEEQISQYIPDFKPLGLFTYSPIRYLGNFDFRMVKELTIDNPEIFKYNWQILGYKNPFVTCLVMNSRAKELFDNNDPKFFHYVLKHQANTSYIEWDNDIKVIVNFSTINTQENLTTEEVQDFNHKTTTLTLGTRELSNTYEFIEMDKSDMYISLFYLGDRANAEFPEYNAGYTQKILLGEDEIGIYKKDGEENSSGLPPYKYVYNPEFKYTITTPLRITNEGIGNEYIDLKVVTDAH